jgi:hypothetical protein
LARSTILVSTRELPFGERRLRFAAMWPLSISVNLEWRITGRSGRSRYAIECKADCPLRSGQDGAARGIGGIGDMQAGQSVAGIGRRERNRVSSRCRYESQPLFIWTA